ncbi:MAG: DNA-binding protein [Saprospiraceae bacterium]|nr:DNA-binding protein [Saprospiraceae bacterium]MCF8251638.1 DNA-binding protein [Saprospiraceae bacterium]MCF8281359.1 DNA-binding protein [Bacteroidales bacterium]MCF8312272.1 DNA-binding protein [Saprospiraceae bacterium]MCF8441980.1 DNA-binding protein [Saprospiraceae bacterium]
MNLTFKELRDLKHSLPTGSISRIASELNIDEQTVRNYFGAQKYNEGEIADIQVEPGPDGGIVHIEDTRILDLAKQIIEASNQHPTSSN